MSANSDMRAGVADIEVVLLIR